MITRLLAFAQALRGRRRADDELDEELRYHVEMETEANIARGMTAGDARRRAMIALGGVEQTRERVRDQRSTFLDGAARDLQYALRALRHRPAFTAVAVLVLSFGIGANVTIFTLVNAVLFHDLPVPSPHQVVFFYSSSASQGTGSLTYRDYRLIQRDAPGVAALAATQRDWVTLRQFGDPVALFGESVSPNYFSVLGVAPRLGRGFSERTDAAPDSEPVVVISDNLWRTRFEADPAVIGKTLEFDRRLFVGLHGRTRQYTIVGVAPAAFRGLAGPLEVSDYWVPFAQRETDYADTPTHRVRHGNLLLCGRTIGETDAERLRRALPSLSARLREDTTMERGADWSLLAFDRPRVLLPFDPGRHLVPERLAASLLLVSGVVLLVAAANLTGLLMARAVTRRRETGIRLALGASRWKIVREMLAEGAVLGGIGAICSLPAAGLLAQTFASRLPGVWQNRAFALDASVDWRVVTFAAALALASALLVSLMPALRATRTEVSAVLSGGEGATLPAGASQGRRWILAAQVCLSLALLLLAGGAVRAVVRAEHEHPGYDSADVLAVHFMLPEPQEPDESGSVENSQRRRRVSAEERSSMMRAMLQRVSGLPIVSEAALAWASHSVGSEGLPLPLSWSSVVTAREFPRSPVHHAQSIEVTSRYFSVLGIRLLRGRTFDDREDSRSPRVAVVSQALASRMWPGQDPVGERFGMAQPDRTQTPQWLEVIGVVHDVRPPLSDKPIAAYYMPLVQREGPLANALLVKGARGNANLAESVKEEMRRAAPRALVGPAEGIAEAIANVAYPRRLAASVLGLAGGAGLLLALVGIYGVVSFSVASRVREIAIRTALGARRRDIVRLLLHEGAAIVVIGSALGLPLAAGGHRLASSAVVALAPLDWMTIVTLPLVVAGTVLLTCGVPAWRAARTDPTEALRKE